MFGQGSAGPALLHLTSAGICGLLRLCSTESSTSWNVPNGVSSPGPLLGTFGHSFVQPGPPGSTVSWHYLGESSTNLLKDWMQKSQKVIPAAVCGQSNRLASPVSREEEVTLSLWARAGIQWDYIWTKSSMWKQSHAQTNPPVFNFKFWQWTGTSK